MSEESKPRHCRFSHIEISAFQPHSHTRGGLRIEWGTVDVVFGELVVYATPDGHMPPHNETTFREFVLDLLAELGRRVQLED